MFFPDATRAVVKTLDSDDIRSTRTKGVLVNTWHLYRDLDKSLLEKFGGIKKFMNWDGPMISDSGGFQVMSLVKKGKFKGKITDLGIEYVENGKWKVFTPEKSIEFQFQLGTDIHVVLDDFTPPGASRSIAEDSVERTIAWAKRSKKIYDHKVKELGLDEGIKPKIVGVIQGDKFKDLRKTCAEKLVEIGFDGLGFGGWPVDGEGKLDKDLTIYLREITPKNMFLYGLGVGKPEDICFCVKNGYQIFDCVIPTRDARHGRLFVYNPDFNKINLNKENFYSCFLPKKEIYKGDTSSVSEVCDCLLCKNYSRGYLHHLFKIGDMSAYRLASIHNLRFYSLLMKSLQSQANKG